RRTTRPSPPRGLPRAARAAPPRSETIDGQPRPGQAVSLLDVVEASRAGPQLLVEADLAGVALECGEHAVGDRAGDNYVGDPARAQAREVAVRVGRPAWAGQLERE